MSVGGKENYGIPREAISPVTNDIVRLQIKARGRIDDLIEFLSKEVDWSTPSDNGNFERRILKRVYEILQPNMPMTFIESLPLSTLDLRLKIVREIADVIGRDFPEVTETAAGVTDDAITEAQKDIPTLFNIERGNLQASLQLATESIRLLYKHDPQSLRNTISWAVDTSDTKFLQTGLV